MSDGVLSPDDRLILRRLADGDLLWLYDPSPVEDAWLHTSDGGIRVARQEFDALLARGLIVPVLGVTSRLYGITDAGRQGIGVGTALRRAG